MAAESLGPVGWEMSRDEESHRTYRIVFKVKTDDVNDGPFTILGATGIPATGVGWGYGNDLDPYALCWPTAKVTQHPAIRNRESKGLLWYVEKIFSTKPLTRCQTATVTDPLSEPQKVSGSFVKYVKKTEIDRNGNAIKTSSHEPIKVERDANRPSVVIEQNVAALGLPTFSAMVDTLNDATLWGLAARRIKLSNVSWERKLYGTCTYYYTRRFEFDIRYEGWDEADIVDSGFKKFDTTIPGGNRNNPAHYILANDRRGHGPPVKVPLDGNGDILGVGASPVMIPGSPIEVLEESNFLTLGIPTSF